MAETTRITSLDVLLDPTGKMLLSEAYDGVLENVQKTTISSKLKNTDLSGDPTAGTVEAKRFVNATSKAYGTARGASAGDKVKGKPVTIPIDTDREFVEEIEQKDVSLLGVDGLIAKRSANHALRMAAELDSKFFEIAATEGTKFTPTKTDIQDIVEEAIVTLETLKNDYIDGVDRSLMSITFDPATYSQMRSFLDTKVNNSNVDTSQEEFFTYHGVRCYSSVRLPISVAGKTTTTTKFILQVDGSIAQPIRSTPYAAERIPMSEAMAVELFFYYGTKAVTPETILVYNTEVTPS